MDGISFVRYFVKSLLCKGSLASCYERAHQFYFSHDVSIPQHHVATLKRVSHANWQLQDYFDSQSDHINESSPYPHFLQKTIANHQSIHIGFEYSVIEQQATYADLVYGLRSMRDAFGSRGRSQSCLY